MADSKKDSDEKSKDTEAPKALSEQISTTDHEITIDGKNIQYTAVAGNYLLKEDNGKVRASFFFIAYRKKDSAPQKRPVTFTFNGGPGSSSVWLHMGLFGPKKIVLDEFGNAPSPQGQLEENAYSLLDHTDLVFIDPMSTGYSRGPDEEKTKSFHGLEGDIKGVGDFIHLWLTRNERWASPKFLSGESYGTTRAAGLSDYLAGRHGIYLNGILFISTILNFQTVSADPGNDLSYPLYLPSYTACAWYHGLLSPEYQKDLQATLREAEEFAAGEYSAALFQGNRLCPEKAKAIAKRLSELTGLDQGWIERSNLRIEIIRFTRELTRNKRRSIGRLDGRYLGMEPDATGEYMSYDPSYSGILGAYASGLNTYMRSELKYTEDMPYEILTNKVRPWDYKPSENKYVDVTENLRSALCQNPKMKLFVASGYYDLATPYFAADYSFSHLGIEDELKDNIKVYYYEAGHMMYIHQPSLVQLKKDLGDFMADCLKD